MRFRLIDAALVGVLAISLAISTSMLAPATAQAYTWGPWTTRWYTASAAECQKAKDLENQFIGPIAHWGHGCQYPVRVRYAAINPTSWVDRKVQIENDAPYWNAWGMTLTVDVKYNGSVAKYDTASLWCTERSFIIKVTRNVCTVYNTGTSDMLIRMAYDASFISEGMVFSVQRGAETHVFGDGPEIGVKRWP